MPFGGKGIASHCLRMISFEDGFSGSRLLPVSIDCVRIILAQALKAIKD